MSAIYQEIEDGGWIVLTAIKLLTRFSSIRPICIADERESFGSLGFSVLGEEDTGNMSES